MGVAETIREQLGRMALMMMGAKSFVKGTDDKGCEYLSFRIMKNKSKINYIKITLNFLDLYDIEFGYIYGGNFTIKSASPNTFVGDMHSVIEDATGLYLSLGSIREDN